ncbi:MAG: hypothetical protein KDE20_15940 [Caldilineaceae bacterium]|nr:hypothetical protein [Caldilineaceae bacterium]
MHIPITTRQRGSSSLTLWLGLILAVALLVLGVVGALNVPRAMTPSAAGTTLASQPMTAIESTLRVSPDNPRYFADSSGHLVYLTGSHTWSNLQDGGFSNPPPEFDYTAYLDFLADNHHNFFRLWAWENGKWGAGWSDDFWIEPMPYARTGPGTALDGGPKYDVSMFNQAYFDRLRARVVEAQDRGMYVSIMLFNGWSLDDKDLGGANPWHAHPFQADNNVNGINGDPNGDDSGQETHSLQIDAITALQEQYVKHVIDTVNDLDNVLYEISNESGSQSQDWQYHMIQLIKEYEATKPKQHPVGITVEYPGGDNGELWRSNADWISPNGSLDDIPPNDGSKVVLLDTDHLCGICGDRAWLWKSVTRGYNPLLMDPYDGVNWGFPPGYAPTDPTWVSLRLNMGYARMYAERMDLAHMTPQGELCSTGYCLAKPTPAAAAYLVYAPDGGTFTVDLSATAGDVHVEWFNPATGATTVLDDIAAGAVQSFTPPFDGDAVLYLYQDAAPADEPNKAFLPLVEHRQATGSATGYGPCDAP